VKIQKLKPASWLLLPALDASYGICVYTLLVSYSLAVFFPSLDHSFQYLPTKFPVFWVVNI